VASYKTPQKGKTRKGQGLGNLGEGDTYSAGNRGGGGPCDVDEEGGKDALLRRGRERHDSVKSGDSGKEEP